jgi:hypothetical protein
MPFGTFRASGSGRRLAAEAAKLTASPYEEVRDTYAFKGPVAGEPACNQPRFNPGRRPGGSLVHLNLS